MSHAVIQAQQCAVLLQQCASHLSVCWRPYTLAAQVLIKSDCRHCSATNAQQKGFRQRVSCGNAESSGAVCVQPCMTLAGIEPQVCEWEALQLSMPVPAKQAHLYAMLE